jgi:hypothetical protein
MLCSYTWEITPLKQQVQVGAGTRQQECWGKDRVEMILKVCNPPDDEYILKASRGNRVINILITHNIGVVCIESEETMLIMNHNRTLKYQLSHTAHTLLKTKTQTNKICGVSTE